MLHELTIKAPAAELALDHQALYASGLEHLQRLASQLWTDHNVHDPGITTLELLCYALTDLSYRAGFSLPDLLAPDPAAAAPRKQFFTAREILPNAALTARDYRKLLIDLTGVENAWIRPASLEYRADRFAGKLLLPGPALPDTQAVPVRGLYDVRIEFAEDVATAEEQGTVLARVGETLNANRNLCEDFLPPRGVERESFRLCGELELEPGPDTNVSAVCAEILFQVQAYLAPRVRSYSLAEMLEKRRSDGTRRSVPEIFEGPALANGFIPDEEIDAADLRTEIRLSDVISVVMDIPGVRVVRDMVINPEATSLPADKWVVPVTPDHQPTLNRASSRLIFYKGGMPIPAEPAKVEARYRQLAEQARAQVETPRSEDIAIPRGQRRDVGAYYSFQNHFPVVYGLGPDTDDSDPRRQALALQLRAYLLFFDQVMADYCAQLDHIGDLFSTDPDLERTYFHQVVQREGQDSEKIYAAGDAEKAVADVDNPRANAEDAHLHADRRHRFLDHLIARVAERFHEYAAIVQSAFGTTQGSLRRQKCRFLEDYPAISSPRGVAYNYELEGVGARWNSANVSGLEKRLCRLLDIASCSRRDLSDIPGDSYAEVYAASGKFRFRVIDRDDGARLLRSSFPYSTAADALDAMKRALRAAQSPRQYERYRTSDGKFSFDVVDESLLVKLAGRDDLFDDEAAREDAIDHLVAYAREHYGEEGMYLIENILLRTTAAEDLLLPICATPGCIDCPALDPYSYRIHVVLPADAGRFANSEFRRFAEEVIRTETPAHILPKICWINRDDMVALEKVYRAWVESGPGAPDSVLRALIDVLYAVKNVYPPRALAGCDAGEGQPKFMLGRAALGTGDGR
jgi:hypothetical protein